MRLHQSVTLRDEYFRIVRLLAQNLVASDNFALARAALHFPIQSRAGFGLIDALEIVFFFDHIAGASQTKQQSRTEGIVFLPLLQQVNRLIVTAYFFE